MAQPWIRVRPDPTRPVRSFEDLRQLNTEMLEAVQRQLSESRAKDEESALQTVRRTTEEAGRPSSR